MTQIMKIFIGFCVGVLALFVQAIPVFETDFNEEYNAPWLDKIACWLQVYLLCALICSF